MKALVLTCDRYRVITEHMIGQYARLWPGHPFEFQIPYQEDRGEDAPGRRRYLRTPRAIKATVLALLEGLGDEEWVYWCIDDKYPVRLELAAIVPLLAGLEDEERAAGMDGLLFCRVRQTMHDPAAALLPGTRTDAAGNVLLERRSWHQIWLHQFLRVKVLRGLFGRFPDDMASAKVMDELKWAIPKPPEHHLLVTARNHAAFGESTKAGRITQNCHESALASGLTLPTHFAEHDGRRSVVGRNTVEG